MRCLNFENYVILFIFFLLKFTKQSVSLGVIGTRDAQHYPFFAVVGRGDVTCGGALITPNLVATAATCLYDQKRNQWPEPQQIYVLHGCFKKEWNVRYYSCEQYKVHYGFDPKISRGPAPYDIALVRIKKIDGTIENFVRPCRFSLRNYYQFGTLIGLAPTNRNQNMKSRGLVATVLQKYDKCGKFENVGYHFNLTHQECYRIVGKVSEYISDLGSPLFYQEGDHVKCLLGIVNYTFENSDHTDYTIVFTSVLTLGKLDA